MSGASSFLAELKRRNVYRAAVFYAASAWLLVQVATQVFPFFHIAEWVVRWIVVAAIVGFPFAITFSWFYEWTPEGFRRDNEVDPAVSVMPATGRRLDRWIFVVMGAAIVLLLADRFVLHKDSGEMDDRSIAVLPLVNESGDPNNEYFSDGLSEDLINALTQLKGLRVIGRSSSFQFKDKADDSQAIGAKLGVSNLLEGTVRKLGDRLRISAALIRAADGTQVWAQSYDRAYKDIFDIQSEIAHSVAQALSSQLLGDRQSPIVAQDRPPNGNLQAYEAYLQGNFHYDRFSREDFRKAIDYYQQALHLEPRYALALARMSIAWTDLASQSGGEEETQAYANARTAAQQALALDPGLAAAHYALGWLILSADWNFAGARTEFQRAAELAPDDALAKNGLAAVLADLGQFDRAIAMEREAMARDPMQVHYRGFLALYLLATDRLDEGEAEVRKVLELQPGALGGRATLAMFAILRGDAAAALREAGQETQPSWKLYALALTQFASGDRVSADATLQALIDEHAIDSSAQIASVYAYRKEPDLAFEWLERALVARDSAVTQLLLDPFMRSLRSDPRFAAFCRKVGLPLPEGNAQMATAPAASNAAVQSTERRP